MLLIMHTAALCNFDTLEVLKSKEQPYAMDSRGVLKLKTKDNLERSPKHSISEVHKRIYARVSLLSCLESLTPFVLNFDHISGDWFCKLSRSTAGFINCIQKDSANPSHVLVDPDVIGLPSFRPLFFRIPAAWTNSLT
ncbi:hypothetical protein K435DRAFT_62386 [Dendrothele bispora CBS 962.96]|uniref:Uncharacterized protein n=1 Tax=Dendrothele bispora (strain CBS 962.96) TaxID=1314807 RepID=A0A4S8MU32_DENBC|nr:hypothetical protein K435DRAFT_62386 [Dendrothele bispora CBS 962.96]